MQPFRDETLLAETPSQKQEANAAQFNPELVIEITDSDTGILTPVVTVETFIDFTDVTQCSPLKVKRLLTALCSQAHQGNKTIEHCLFPEPWDSFKLNSVDRTLYGLRAAQAAELYDYITNPDSEFSGFHRGASVSKDALEHFKQIVQNVTI